MVKCSECGDSCDDSACSGSCEEDCAHKGGGRMAELDLDEETKKEIVEYQNLQQQMQMMIMQRQQALAAIAELDQAAGEVGKSSGTVYRFVGSVIVPKKKDELLAELKDEKASLENRRDVFAKQEERLRKRFDELQRKLQAKLGGGSGGESKPTAKMKAKKPSGEGAVLSG